MALVVADRVKETTTSVGLGTINLAGAVTGGFDTFVSGVGSGNTTYYAIVDSTNSYWEVGIGTVTGGSPDTLSRDTVLASSNSGSKVNFSTGTKYVFATQPADKAVYLNASNQLVINGTAVDYVSSTGDSMTGNLDFGQNNQAIFGDADDLKIYHSIDGSQDRSTILHTGNKTAGSLDIRANRISMLDQPGNAFFLDAFEDSGVELYWNATNSKKFETTSGGAKVTGNLQITGTPTNATDATTKSYVDGLIAAGIHYHEPVRVERPDTDGNLTATYDNGTDGVGATLTGAQEVLVIDGVTLALNDRVLLYNQTNAYENGIYYVSTLGEASTTNWVLTRATDADSYGLGNQSLSEGTSVFVSEGNDGAGEVYTCNTTGTITFGTTDINFTQIGKSAVYTGGTGITVDGSTISVTDNTIGATQLNVSGNGTAGQVLKSDGDGTFSWAADNNTTYTAGTGLTLTGTQFSNSAPDQTVSLTGSGATTVSGTYPSFTISSTNTQYSAATSSTLGLSKLGSDSEQTTAANTVTTTANRTYAVQHNSDDQMVVNVPWSDTNTVYTHPTHPGDDFSVDTGPLTGATVVSDIDINVTTDTLGHVTDANGTVATRTLTLADLGYTGETNATADQTASEILTAIKTVDGSGSGLDADLLDGVQGSAFLRSNADDTATGQITFPGAIASRPILPNGYISGNSGDADADIWGISETYYPSHGTAANAYGIRWNSTENQVQFVGSGTNKLVIDLDGGSGGLTWEGNTIYHTGNDGTGSGLDADTVDGLQASSFIRSDQNDMVYANTTWDNGEKVLFGSSSNMEIYHENIGGVPASYIKNTGGHLYIQNNANSDDNSNIYIRAKSGENSIVCNDDSYVSIYDNGVERMRLDDPIYCYADLRLQGANYDLIFDKGTYLTTLTSENPASQHQTITLPDATGTASVKAFAQGYELNNVSGITIAPEDNWRKIEIVFTIDTRAFSAGNDTPRLNVDMTQNGSAVSWQYYKHDLHEVEYFRQVYSSSGASIYSYYINKSSVTKVTLWRVDDSTDCRVMFEVECTDGGSYVNANSARYYNIRGSTSSAIGKTNHQILLQMESTNWYGVEYYTTIEYL